MNDRRVRLRPKDGVRGFYYGGGFSGLSTSSSSRQSLLAQSLSGISNLPWLANRAAASQAPNTPNYITQGVSSSFSDPFNTSISNVGTNSSDSAGIASAINARDAAGIQEALGSSGTITGFTDNQVINVGNFIEGLGDITSLFGASSNVTMGSPGGLLEPLAQTNGLVFPYTPTIDFSQQVDYTSYDPTHSNQELMSYTRTKAANINISGKFTVQNSFEASYALAAFHFCRVVSKMAFGQSMNPGTPPPILLLSAYGSFAFNDIPVIVTSFNITFPDDVDYIRIQNTDTYMPAIFSIQLSLVVQNTAATLRSFSLEQFRSGSLLLNRGWT